MIDEFPIMSWSFKELVDQHVANSTTKQEVNHKLGSLNSNTASAQQQSPNSVPEFLKNINNIDNKVKSKNNNTNMTKTTDDQSSSKNSSNGASDNVINNNIAPSQSSLTNHSISTPLLEANNSKQQTNCDKKVESDDLHDMPQNTFKATIEKFNEKIDSRPAPRVIYPFMKVPELNFDDMIKKFEVKLKNILSFLRQKRFDNQEKCRFMNELLDYLSTNKNTHEISAESETLKKIAHCLASILVDDFTTKIFPSSCSYNNQSNLDDLKKTLEKSLKLPFFELCRNSFDKVIDPIRSKTAMTLLVNIYNYFEATSFLVLYWLRAHHLVQTIAQNVINHGHLGLRFSEFCHFAKRKNPNKILYHNLKMAATYDVEIFCFLLPSLFGDMAACGIFNVTGNIDLIRLVIANFDPISLQELICLCLTGTAKVINRDDVLPLIEASLYWESWEQFNLWRLISAQAVPIENYMSILPKLNSKDHPEAMSSILLNLQKINEPTIAILQTLINCECNINNPFVSSILRYWSMKTDVQDLARLITSLVDTKPPSPSVKWKGAIKSKTAPTPASLTPQTEKILNLLDHIRIRAPKNKLLAQSEVIDMLSQLEDLCDEQQKLHFDSLFQNRPKPAKKQKKS